MNIKLHLINASGSLNAFIEDIQLEFSRTIKIVTEKLPLDNIDVVIWDNSESTIEQYGIGGHTIKANYISISLAPKNPNIHKNFRKNFENTLIHEFNHAARMQALPREYVSRLEASIMEGVAEHFEIEVTGKQPEIWDTAVTGKDLKKFVKIAKENKSTTDYIYYDWLFGNKKTGIPEWTGYSVGFYLVGEYLKKHPDKKASTIYALDEKEFV